MQGGELGISTAVFVLKEVERRPARYEEQGTEFNITSDVEVLNCKMSVSFVMSALSTFRFNFFKSWLYSRGLVGQMFTLVAVHRPLVFYLYRLLVVAEPRRQAAGTQDRTAYGAPEPEATPGSPCAGGTGRLHG